MVTLSDAILAINPDAEFEYDDIDNILAGLKTKPINIQNNDKDDSVISANSIGNFSTNSKTPKRTQKRKQRSDKNTISLDI